MEYRDDNCSDESIHDLKEREVVPLYLKRVRCEKLKQGTYRSMIDQIKALSNPTPEVVDHATGKRYQVLDEKQVKVNKKQILMSTIVEYELVTLTPDYENMIGYGVESILNDRHGS